MPASTSDSEQDPFSFDISEDLVPVREQKSAGQLVLDLDGLLEPPLRLHEDLKEGNGGQAWPAGMLLATHLLRYHQGDLEGKTMFRHIRRKSLELYASQLLEAIADEQYSLALALGLPHHLSTAIRITDLEPMLDLMKHNIALNEASLKSQVTPSIYAWGSPPPTQLPMPPDVVLAADCVYFEPAFPLLLQTLGDLIGRKTVCWFCFKRRRRADMIFAKDLKKAFEVVEVEPKGGEDDWRMENLHLYRVTKKHGSLQLSK